MKITPDTTIQEVEEYLKQFPRDQAKVLRAQLLHQRRIMRIEQRKEDEKNDPHKLRVRPQYMHSIFDRSKK